MAVIDQQITDRWAVYNGDCMDVLARLPDERVHMSIYSPPFAGLYHYSSSPRDLSNCSSYDDFFEHYTFVVRELHRVMMPGRISVVHCMDVPTGNSGRNDALIDFPGDIIRLHEREGFRYVARRCVWKEPLQVRNRTLAKGLAHRTIVDDSTQSSVASADYVISFRREGDNPIPVAHPVGLMEYAGASSPPADILRFRGWNGDQKQNKFSHWIWRRYASSIWDDIRLDRVLPYRAARDEEDEKHVHPLQLDVIERACVLYSNPGETVLTPFMGVGSEVFGAVSLGRRGLGVELKPTYYRQAIANLELVDEPVSEQVDLGDFVDISDTDPASEEAVA